jgi:predicted membrane protein
MLSGALFAVYGSRVMKEAEFQREQRKQKAEKEKTDVKSA